MRGTPLRLTGCGKRLTTVVLAVVATAGLAGCGKMNHRISLEEFRALQARADAERAYVPQWKALADNAVIDQRLSGYRLGPGDVVTVTVRTTNDQFAMEPTRARVNDQGQIDLVMVGKLDVNDLTIQEAEAVIRRAYLPRYFREASIHVALEQAAPTRVIVMGAVTNPGMITLRRTDRDLLHAVIAAGGMSLMSSGEVTLQRLRQPDKAVTVDFTDPMGIKAMLTMEPLQSGDIIRVHPATPNTYFVGGLVNAPRPQMYPPGTTVNVLQALAGSAGLRTDVTPKTATLVRRMPNGEDVHVELDLQRMWKGQDPNIALRPGDILWVPETPLTKVQEFINRVFYLRVGANVSYALTGRQDLFTLEREDINDDDNGDTFILLP
ncbi:MAG: polysaccharide biosynthesis/export family protein [Planctomycetota bacterium]